MDKLEGNLAGELRTSAWYDPTSRKIYQGRIGNTQALLMNLANPKQAQLFSVADISSVNIPILLQEILGLQRPVYNLRNVCRVINMNALKATIPIFTKPTAQEKVPPLTEASLEAAGWTSLTFSLWKNVTHIVVSDEIQKVANVDVFGTQTRDAAGALSASENNQIAAALDAGTESQEIAGSDWGTITSGRSVNNPYKDIIGVMVTIATAGYRPNAVVAHPTGWSAFFGNDFVKGQLAGAVYPDLSKGGGFPIPGLPGVTGYSDFFMTPTTSAYVLDTVSGVILGAGPTEAARYRNEEAGYDAFIMRQWLQPQIGVAAAIAELEGIHS